MGFNGGKALAFKLAYLKEFNRMEQSLNALQNGTAPARPRFNAAMTNWLKNVCQQSEEQIASYSSSVYGCLQNFRIKIFDEEANKRVQAHFLKTYTKQVLQASANGQFKQGSPERNYQILMGILTSHVEVEMEKANRALALVGESGF